MTALGSAPEHWRRTTMSDVADVRLGRQRSPKNHKGDAMRPYLRAANVDWYGLRPDDIQEMNFTDDEMEAYALRENDILVVEGSGSAAEVGKCALVPKTFGGHAFQNTLIRVRPGADLDPRWLMYRINAEAELGGFLTLARGSGIFHLGSTRTAKWPIAVPPLDEQRAVVEAIERMLSHLDAAERARASAARRLPVARAALLRKLVARQGVAPLLLLEEVAEILDAHRVPVNATERAKRPGEVPYYGATGQVDTIDEALFNEPLVLLGEDGVKFDNPTVMKAYSIEGPAWVNNHAHVLRPKPVVRQRWLEAALNAANYEGLFSGTTRLKLNQGQMKKLRVPVPSLEDQDSIIELMDAAQTLLSHAGTATRDLAPRTEQLRRSILKAAFEGRLTSSPADALSVDELEEAFA